MTPRHPAHRSDPCAFCGRHREGDDLVHVSLLWPTRKRGWVCREHVEAKIQAGQVASFALAREALLGAAWGDRPGGVTRGGRQVHREG